MQAVDDDKQFALRNPRTREIVKEIKAREIFDLIIEKAWSNGEPGIIFIDKINEHNPLKKIGTIESTNPCGEQPLLPFESCNLGSINLSKILARTNGSHSIDYELLKRITEKAVHFLDNVIDMNNYPLEQINIFLIYQ